MAGLSEPPRAEKPEAPKPKLKKKKKEKKSTQKTLLSFFQKILNFYLLNL